MTKEEIKELYQQIRENSKRLQSCKRHSFGDCPPVQSGQVLSRVKLKCAHCGGEMYLSDIVTYVEGYKAAGGNHDDVLRGLDKPATKAPTV